MALNHFAMVVVLSFQEVLNLMLLAALVVEGILFTSVGDSIVFVQRGNIKNRIRNKNSQKECLGGVLPQYMVLSVCAWVCVCACVISQFSSNTAQRPTTSYGVDRLNLMAPIYFWQNSTPL